MQLGVEIHLNWNFVRLSWNYIRVIVTTNFDRLMENALREVGVEPTVVASVDALRGAEPPTHSACYILKLHGDYKDARILNTDAELNVYPSEYDQLLDRLMDEYGLIVCGWSGDWDHALRAAFLRAPNRRYPVFWATRGNIGDGAQELIRQRCARVMPIDNADTFFSTLHRRVDTLEQSRRQNPLGIELQINTTKRLLCDTLGAVARQIDFGAALCSQRCRRSRRHKKALLPDRKEREWDRLPQLDRCADAGNLVERSGIRSQTAGLLLRARDPDSDAALDRL